ncbi:MAG: Gldg family protein [Odoribacter sp.]
MKTIYKIAKAELQNLFYSPVAWLILIIFTVQVSMNFMDMCANIVSNQDTGWSSSGITGRIFCGPYSFYAAVRNYLYLYIPLLTMGLMSRELGSGSINLLYSSPVTNTQIILGKYLSMMIYGLVLMAIMLVYVIFGICTIDNADISLMLAGMLGIYLLLCAYAAVGLFMSSLTSYQVVAAIGTLAILSFLNFVNNLWQGVALVRDIMYWLCLAGRTDESIQGFIRSEDVLYFVIVIALFLSLTIIRLQARRQKNPWMVTVGKYLGVTVIAMFLGYVSSRPALMCYYDATRTKSNTLTVNSQKIVSQLKGGLTITTYNNLLDKDVWVVLPHTEISDMQLFRQYTRFKPEIEMKYVYYYDEAGYDFLKQAYPNMTNKERAESMTTAMSMDFNRFLSPEEIHKKIDLSSEGNHFVRLVERESGEKTFLRIFNDPLTHPGESEITVALKRLVARMPLVGFLTGHGERDNKSGGDRDYKLFAQDKPYRTSLINQGFDFTDVTLNQEIPEDIDILVIAEMRQALTDAEIEILGKYISRGGNLMIAGEPKRMDVMNPLLEQFGVKLMPGCLVQPTPNYRADLILAKATREAGDIAYTFRGLNSDGRVITMPNCTGLEYTTDKGYEVKPLLVTESKGVWNELETIDFIDDTVKLNPAIGEVEKAYATALALSRKVGQKEQKIIILGDADCISNIEFQTTRKDIFSANYTLVTGSFYWLSDGQAPIDVRRPALSDNNMTMSKEGVYWSKIGLIGVWPALMLLLALFIWIRRRGR